MELQLVERVIDGRQRNATQPARAHADQKPLTVATIRKVVLSMYHRGHDYWTDADIAELLPELTAFNITTVKQLRLLMKRHRRALLREERTKMPRAQTLDLLAGGGWHGIDVHANTSWFAIGGLVRISMEHEFGFETMLPFHEIRDVAMELDAEAQT